MISFAVLFGLLIYLEVGVYLRAFITSVPYACVVAWDDIHGYSWILDSALCIPDSLSVKLGFRNQIVSGISKVCFLFFLFLK